VSARIVLILDGPEITVAQNEQDIPVFIVEAQVVSTDEEYAKDVWKSFPDDLRHFVEGYMEPNWVEEAKVEIKA